MPTIVNGPPAGSIPGNHASNTVPTVAPRQPPMTIDGPNTPPEPPEPIVSDVVSILPIATKPRTASGGPIELHSLTALWSVPYPDPITARTEVSRATR